VIATIGRLAASHNASVAPSVLQSLHHRSPAVRDAARKGLLSLDVPEVLASCVADDRLDAVTREAFARHLAEGDGPRRPRDSAGCSRPAPRTARSGPRPASPSASPPTA